MPGDAPRSSGPEARLDLDIQWANWHVICGAGRCSDPSDSGHVRHEAKGTAIVGVPSHNRSTSVYEALFVVSVVGIGFQVVHFAEHIAQLTHWFTNPQAPAWISSWAIIGSDSLASLADGGRPTGVEFLHLIGNVIFLSGLMALTQYKRRTPGGSGRMEWLAIACIIQTVHVIEHVALTATQVAGGKAIGFSTAFGALSGSELVQLRVWFHFFINFIATATTLTYLATVYIQHRSSETRRRGRVARLDRALAS